MFGAARRTSCGIAAMMAVAAACAAPAAADHPGGDVTVSDSSVSGTEVEVARHGDPVAQFQGGSGEASVSEGEASFQAAAPSICPTVDKTVDDGNNAPHGSSAAVIKVIYAHPINVPNRMQTYGPVIQSGA